MINEPAISATTETVPLHCDRRFLPTLCWGAILGGTVAAIGIHLLLTALGVGGGLATFTPMTDANPVTHFSVGAALVWSLCALVALGFGGLVAGRFSHSLHSGFVHGMLVWCLTLIITLLLLSMGTGMVLGGAMKVLGEGLGIGGKAVAAGAGDVTKEAVKRSGDQLGSFIDEAVQAGPTNAAPNAKARAKREIGFAVTKLFTPGNDVGSKDNRAQVTKALVDYAGMSEADAAKTVDDWTVSYKNLKAELDDLKAVAEQKAREAADQAAGNVSSAALWSFFALLIGLLVASVCGSCGARQALKIAEFQRATVK